ncbi:cardio-excitory peptide-1 [Plakobranchus ocellatus]|uniref:Cardio-excitory peptide-1 n=1 Tax=Plakobranchus ocellatus TaxID=259542 RepID=A0AAV3YXD7_9GAST|nr:cardio-excitory peptide-1 [Plakobranchus ocellatus]
MPDSAEQHGFGHRGFRDVPVELILSKKELERGEIKPRVCSLSGLRGYPLCDTDPSFGVNDAGDLLDDLLRLR